LQTDYFDVETLYEQIVSELDSINIDELNKKDSNCSVYKNELSELRNAMQIKQHEIEHARKMLSKLEHHQWDPNCQYCVANPWLQDTQQAANKLPELRDAVMTLMTAIRDIERDLNQSDVKNELARYYELQRELNTKATKKNSAAAALQTVTNKLTQLQSNLLIENNLLEKARTCLDDIEFNKHQNSLINELRAEITSVSKEIRELESTIVDLSGKLSIARKSKQTAEDAISRLSELEIQYKGYEYYLQSVKRDGVPYQLIERALPQIEAEINNILTQVVDFTMILNTDGKNIHGYIVYDDDNYWPLELTSGMEKFISSLAIRTSLINITNLPRPNFLAIDEGFGVLDSDNLNSMYMLFDYLKSQFGFVLCISHIDAMRDVVDKLIEIKKEHGYSKIEFS
jgi:DNA repair exonuclease SbcCD ATPase subunit